MPETVRKIDHKIELAGNCVSYRSLASYHMPMHDHDALQILVPLEGAHFEISWCSEDKSKESMALGVADICIIPPYLEHEVRWSNIANFVSYYIKPSYMDAQLETGFDPQTNIVETKIGLDDQMLYQLTQSLRHAFWLLETPHHKYIDAVFTVVAQHVVNNYLVRDTDQKTLFNDYAQIPCVKIREAILYIQNHLNRHLTVEEMADSVDMSHYHFIRTFKESVGMPPSKFHMMLRIEKAKELLSRQEKIIDVAMALGFSSQSHFSQAFSKLVGLTPSKFAKH